MRRSRSLRGRPVMPKPMFPSTVSQGKTPRSWKTKMRRGSGPCTISPPTFTSPSVGDRKPAMMFSSVVLPHPDGPRRQRNSPSPTSRLMSSRTLVCLPSRSKIIPTFSTCSDDLTAVAATFDSIDTTLVLRVTPPERLYSFKRPDSHIQQEANDSDDDHASDNEIVAIASVTGIHNKESKPRVDGDHFSRDDDKPGDAQCDPQANDELRHGSRIEDADEEAHSPQTEVSAGVDIDGGDAAHCVHRCQQ